MRIVRHGEESLLMSQAVIHGGVAYFAGQVGDGRPDTPVFDQTRETLAKIDRLLAACGSDRERVLSATIWLRSIDQYADMNRAWVEWLPAAAKPARATAGGIELALPVYDVEIIITAAV